MHALRSLAALAAGMLSFAAAPMALAQTSAVGSSVMSTGINTFPAHIKVQRGGVLALSNATSGIYMAMAAAGTGVRYFPSPLSDGASGKPNHVASQLHLLLSADVKS